MASKTWANFCLECGKQVEILNGDFEFSMDLHKQSHKSLEYVNTIDKNLNHATEKIDNNSKLKLNYCHDCNENFAIINNDLSLSFQLHSQKHKNDNSDALSDHSSASSSKSKVSQKSGKEKEKTQPTVTSILDAIFHTMPPGLQAHREFISEQSCSKALCNLCEITIDPIFSVSEHLKTKLHEDNTISVIKALLSSELHDEMEFISFYGSNLCCNLCRSKIDLCSDNLHKTVVNIFVHNAGKGHSSKKTTSKDNNQADCLVVLKSLALMSPLVSENQKFIEHKIYPHFKCKACDKQIAYSENHTEMLNNFTSHFNSQGHIKYLSAVSLLSKWSTLNISGKERHDFCVSKHTIHCLTCNCDVESNLDQLLFHVRKNSALYGKVQPDFEVSVESTNLPCIPTADVVKDLNTKSEHEECVTNPNINQTSQSQDTSAKFRRLVQSLPMKFRNIITENKKGEAVCSICKCTIPATTYNLTTHLNGSSHNKKEGELLSFEKFMNNPQPPKTCGDEAKETNAKFVSEFDLLASSHPLVRANNRYFVRCSVNKYICTLCGTFIQGDANSLQRISLSHIESQDHVHKVQVKKEMSQLLHTHREDSVRELFNCIPMSFLKDMKYIKAPEGVSFVFCEICFLKIPKHRNCLLEHLEGGYHESSVERLAGIQLKKGPSIEIKRDEINDIKLNQLVMKNKLVKANAKCLSKNNDDYFCKLCKAIIKNSNDIGILEANIVGHMNGKKHKKSEEEVYTNLLDKIELTSTIVKNNRRFLKTENGYFLCTLCPCRLYLADNIDALRNNLEVHLSGNSHKSKWESMYL